jgi:CMP-N,N'-diacetyllegionaminic acid synthase
MEFLGLIPARGGSKRIKNKNIVELGGLPLISHTIIAAQSCLDIERICLSTDDPAIVKIGQDYDIEVHERPNELATDTSDAFSLICYYFELYKEIENIIYLQPTSPFRKADSIASAIQHFRNTECDVLVSVCTVPHALNSSKQMEIMGNGLLVPVRDNPYRAQDTPVSYYRNGPAILIINRKILKKRSLYEGKVVPFLMGKIESLDIDEPEDLNLARALYMKKQE